MFNPNAFRWIFLRYKKVIEVTEELLKTTQSHLPTSDTEDGETCNPVLVALLSELMVPPCYPSVSHSSKVTMGSFVMGTVMVVQRVS